MQMRENLLVVLGKKCHSPKYLLKRAIFMGSVLSDSVNLALIALNFGRSCYFDAVLLIFISSELVQWIGSSCKHVGRCFKAYWRWVIKDVLKRLCNGFFRWVVIIFLECWLTTSAICCLVNHHCTQKAPTHTLSFNGFMVMQHAHYCNWICKGV